MMGVMALARALQIARERNLDLVEVSPNAMPPVCKLLDYGRFKYEQAKKENEARKNQKTITLKEIRMRPRTDDHDVAVKTRKIQEFLAEGDKVRVSVQFRGPDMRHPDIGRKLLDGIAEELKGMATIERSPVMEGRMMSMIVSRAPGWEPPKKQTPPASTKASTKNPPESDENSSASHPDSGYFSDAEETLGSLDQHSDKSSPAPAQPSVENASQSDNMTEVPQQ